jgi:hypothetical protein
MVWQPTERKKLKYMLAMQHQTPISPTQEKKPASDPPKATKAMG